MTTTMTMPRKSSACVCHKSRSVAYTDGLLSAAGRRVTISFHHARISERWLTGVVMLSDLLQGYSRKDTPIVRTAGTLASHSLLLCAL